jgi:hypothetical protein
MVLYILTFTFLDSRRDDKRLDRASIPRAKVVSTWCSLIAVTGYGFVDYISDHLSLNIRIVSLAQDVLQIWNTSYIFSPVLTYLYFV